MLKFSKYFVGILFIISGLIKLNDPIGFSIKLEEYFVIFGMQFLNPLTLTLSVFICAIEVVLGFALLFNIHQKKLAWVLLGLIVFFTILTGYSAITGKVTDCGCFGDAIKLTPWQSFIKDIVLMVFILVIFVNRDKIVSKYSIRNQTIILSGSLAVSLVIGVYCISFLPLVDFLPYKPGNNIPELMKYPEGAPRDSFETRMVYQKDGKEETFTLSNYPWQDSTWKWVRTENILIKEGYKPKIKDLRISDADGNDYSEDIINFEGYSIWVVAYDFEKTNKKVFSKINEVAASLEKSDSVRTIGLTSSNADITEAFRHEFNTTYPFYYCDATTLKTMVRANPGILLIHNGTILAKWHFNSMPDAMQIKSYL